MKSAGVEPFLYLGRLKYTSQPGTRTMSSERSFRWILVSCKTTMSASNVSNMACGVLGSVADTTSGFRGQPHLESAILPPWLISEGIPGAGETTELVELGEAGSART